MAAACLAALEKELAERDTRLEQTTAELRGREAELQRTTEELQAKGTRLASQALPHPTPYALLLLPLYAGWPVFS